MQAQPLRTCVLDTDDNEIEFTRWYNEHRLTLALDKLEDDERDELLDALDEIMREPYGPLTTFMTGTPGHVERRIWILPRGWVLVFAPYPQGVIPLKEPGLLVRD